MNTTHDIKVAVVDDSPLIRNSMQLLLGRWGYNVVFKAMTNKELFNRLSPVSAPDICIADINLRERKGYEIMKALKQEWPDMKLLIFGPGSNHEAEQVLQAGADMFVSKEDPLAALRNALTTISFTINH